MIKTPLFWKFGSNVIFQIKKVGRQTNSPMARLKGRTRQTCQN